MIKDVDDMMNHDMINDKACYYLSTFYNIFMVEVYSQRQINIACNVESRWQHCSCLY